jgi:hypothetical protein
MRLNVGSTDRVVRIVVGLALVIAPFVSGLALFANPVAMWVSVIVGAVLLVTAAVGFCPLYRLLGLSTRKSS